MVRMLYMRMGVLKEQVNLLLVFASLLLAYAEFNGAAINYDGLGRSVSDNNSLFLLGWLMFRFS
jgi:hypothetical protein